MRAPRPISASRQPYHFNSEASPPTSSRTSSRGRTSRCQAVPPSPSPGTEKIRPKRVRFSPEAQNYRCGRARHLPQPRSSSRGGSIRQENAARESNFACPRTARTPNLEFRMRWMVSLRRGDASNVHLLLVEITGTPRRCSPGSRRTWPASNPPVHRQRPRHGRLRREGPAGSTGRAGRPTPLARGWRTGKESLFLSVVRKTAGRIRIDC
jgi:hypothetical protein